MPAAHHCRPRTTPGHAVRLQKNAFTIFSKFEYPEALVRFIDPWADDTFSIEASYGGPLIRQEADGTRTVTGRGVDWFEHGPHIAAVRSHSCGCASGRASTVQKIRCGVISKCGSC